MKTRENKSYSRARNLGDDDIQEIVTILDGWSGKLSWYLLVESINKRLNQKYTRQALNNHARISGAFRQRKKSLSTQSTDLRPRINVDKSEDQVLDANLQHIRFLEAKVERLEAENERLLEQFVCWAYNASLRGLDTDFLNKPLPRADRQQTTVTMEYLSKELR